MIVARAVISIVPTIAGPIPPTLAGATLGGIELVRNCQLMIEAPLTTVVTKTNPSGMTTSDEREHHQRGHDAVAGATPAFRLPQVELLLFGDDGHQAPRFFRAERSTTQWAMTLMMIVKANRSTPIPIRAARNTPVASPNWFAITAAML